MEALSKNMDLHSSTYENFIFLADFNAALTLKNFSNLHWSANLLV